MKTILQLLATTAAILALAGCSTPDKDAALNSKQTAAFLATARHPQMYGFGVTRTRDGGITYIGQAHLHPNHLATAGFEKRDIPVIKMEGRTPHKNMVAMLDTSAIDSWMGFSTAELFDVKPMGINDQLIPYRGGLNTGNTPAYASVVTQLRIKQLFIENAPIYVRMATGSMGPLARGISDPHVDAVIGYDILSQFEYIQFDIANRRVAFSATIPYVPHENLVLTRATIEPVEGYGLAVGGAIFGQDTPIILDVAGNYHFARNEATDGMTKQVSIGNLVYRQVPTLPLPGRDSPPRAGRQMLSPYLVTICPKEGIVYFERPPTQRGDLFLEDAESQETSPSENDSMSEDLFTF